MKHLLLSVRRQSVEVLQALLKLLLPLWWQTAKSGIALKSVLLLVERLFTIPIKPLPGVMALCRRPVWPRNIVPWLLLRFCALGLCPIIPL
jgi:hypothetical protein